MSEANYKRSQTALVQLGHSTAKVTVIVEYKSPRDANEYLKRVDSFLKYSEEYPDAQLDLLKNNLTTLPVGDSRTDSLAKELKETRPKKSATKKKTIPKKSRLTKKSGRDRAAV